MNVLQTMLALIASNIGGGIVGMPFAIFNCGAVLGTAVILFFGCITQLSVVLLLSTKDLTPRKYESLYEIGYLLMGRWSIFIMCTVLFFTTFGTCVLYFIIFGETLGSTMRQLILDHDLSRIQTDYMYNIQLLQEPLLIQAICTREAAIIFAATVLLMIVFKKQL